MAKKKSIAGRSRRSSKSKTKKASSKAAGSKGQSSVDGPANSDPDVLQELQTSDEAQQSFPDKVYLLASVIFQNNHVEKPASHRFFNYGKERGLPLPEVKDAEMQRTAYELAFNTLKYQELLEDIMVDSGLYRTQPLPDDQMGLFAVMLYDFQDRKFLPWEHYDEEEEEEEEEIVQNVRDVEKYLLKFKTKLAASLARCRIKQDLLSIQCILPDSVKMKQERSSSLPVYAWVNNLTSSCDEVKSVLKTAGFSEVESVGQLEGQSFCQDTHCGDLLVFPAPLKAQLCSTKLLSDHKLIIQDKVCSLGPYVVHSLLPEEGDVLMVGCFSGLSVSHTASLIAEKHKSSSIKNKPTIYVCVGDQTVSQREELQQAVAAMGCKKVTLITEDFQSLNVGDKQLQKVRVILLTPKCSLSAVSNPVDFILQENGDTDLFPDLSQGSVAQSKLEALVAQQTKDIDHALKFPKVLAVVYATCSSHPEENEGVVSRALEQAKARSEQGGEPQQANFRPSSHLFTSPNHSESAVESNPYFILEPSEHNNGCFLAVLKREPEPVVSELPQEVLARANAKGILDKLRCHQSTKKEQHRHTNRMTKTSRVHNSQPHISVSSQSKNQKIKGSNSTALCSHQEFSKRRQSSQGKPRNTAHLQGSNNTVPTSRPGNTVSSSFKPENSSSTKITTTNNNNSNTATTTPPPQHLNTAPFSTPAPHPAPPPAPPPVVRPRKPRQEELKPVVLILPPVHFPDLFPPPYRRAEFRRSISYRRLRTPSQTRSSVGISNDIRVKFWTF